MPDSRDIRLYHAGNAPEGGGPSLACSGRDAGGINFAQDKGLDAFAWDELLYQFIRRYCLNFIKLELLMLFYRSRTEAARAEEIVSRTGYHKREVTVNLDKLVADGLLAEQSVGSAGVQYRRLETPEFAGRGLVLNVLRRMAEDFAQREGRLKII